MNKNEIKAATNQALLGEEWGYEMRRHDVAAGSPDIVFCIVPLMTGGDVTPCSLFMAQCHEWVNAGGPLRGNKTRQ
jgi:hypothetical protein